MSNRQHIKKIFDLGNYSIWLIRIIAGLLAVGFAKYILFFPFTDFLQSQINSISYLIIIKTAIVVLLNSKFYGIIIDIRAIQRELIKVRLKQFPLSGYLLAILYCLPLIMIVFYHNDDNPRLLFYSFVIYWLAYSAFWSIFRPFIKRSIIDTFILNRNDEVEKLQNKIVWRYFADKWTRDIRNWGLIFIIIAIILVDFDLEIYVQNLLSINSKYLISSGLILVSVLFTETLAWTKRMKRKYQIRYLDQHYNEISKSITKNYQ